MISAITADQPIASGAHMADYRHRPQKGERALLADSTPAAREDADARNNREFTPDERETPPQPEAPHRDSSSMFAAAVIAGALPPTPQTMEELIRRIGTSIIPEESQARLKDLLA
jgi:hypothetical protein